MKTPLEELAEHAGDAELFLKSLANRHRLMVLCALVEGELSVSELNARVGLSQSALSQHLAKLRDAGLVATRRQSQTIFYELKDPAVKLIISDLHRIFCSPKREP